jgi:hypothetical protein
LTPEQRSLRGRVGAFVMHSRNDSRATSAPGRAAFLARFERMVDPDGSLPSAERERRADSARRAYMTRLALASSQARSKKKSAPADVTPGADSLPAQVGMVSLRERKTRANPDSAG